MIRKNIFGSIKFSYWWTLTSLGPSVLVPLSSNPPRMPSPPQRPPPHTMALMSHPSRRRTLSCLLHCFLLASYPLLADAGFTAKGTRTDGGGGGEGQQKKPTKVKRILVRTGKGCPPELNVQSIKKSFIIFPKPGQEILLLQTHSERDPGRLLRRPRQTLLPRLKQQPDQQ